MSLAADAVKTMEIPGKAPIYGEAMKISQLKWVPDTPESRAIAEYGAVWLPGHVIPDFVGKFVGYGWARVYGSMAGWSVRMTKKGIEELGIKVAQPPVPIEESWKQKTPKRRKKN